MFFIQIRQTQCEVYIENFGYIYLLYTLIIVSDTSMLEPRTNLQIHIRGGYLEGSRGRYTAKDNFSCINCGEKFSSRRVLGYHHMKCPYYKYVRQPNELKECNCTKCGKKFEDKGHLKFHVDRCGYYVAMQRTTADDIVNEAKSGSNRRDGTVVMTTEQVGKAVASDESAVCEDKVENETVKSEDDTGDNGDVEVKAHVTEDLKISNRKRKIEAMFSHKSFGSIKKLRVEQSGAPLYQTLFHDIEQESLRNMFDRVLARERPYECSKCNAQFKYKNKFEFHMKFVHDELVVTSLCSEDAKEIAVGDCSSDRLERNVSADDQLRIDQQIKEKTILGNDKNNNEMKTRVSNYPCEFCHLSFRYHSRRERHVKSVHKKQPEQVEFWNIFSCTHCPERFPDKRSLLKHYACAHLNNRNSPPEISFEKNNHENFTKGFNVSDVMQHLRRNLLCLQDGTSMNTERDYKARYPKSDLPDNFRYRNADMNRNIENMASRDSDRKYDKPEHEINNEKRCITARKRTFNVQHHHSSNEIKSINVCKETITTSSPEGQKVDGIDTPLDLSLKVKNKVEDVTPDNIKNNKTFAANKPVASERALLLEYYNDFLQEYCLS
ncbi:PR domain zinc finger protein 5-like [Ruditapes philippinarum]|uniref:PR domain zinc finger protein 5-like n=1 Tax=Ruditapes philippinarum TaxID=129788 RepID=UPI00295AB3C7|nr:PR domain zinc finger protein 5-like [Ruditapes philippinarum]